MSISNTIPIVAPFIVLTGRLARLVRPLLPAFATIQFRTLVGPAIATSLINLATASLAGRLLTIDVSSLFS